MKKGQPEGEAKPAITDRDGCPFGIIRGPAGDRYWEVRCDGQDWFIPGELITFEVAQPSRLALSSELLEAVRILGRPRPMNAVAAKLPVHAPGAPPDASRGPTAVIDVGSNTVRLLIASVRDGRIEVVLDESRFVRLGQGVQASGNLNPEREEAAIQAIRDLVQTARDHGAETVVAVATSAVREARNGQDFVARVGAETGLEMRILSGEEEARLTFLGATLGFDRAADAIVCDLGGGSMELITAEGGTIRWQTSLRLGSGRMTERFVAHDPPEPEEREAVARHVENAIRGLPPTNAGTVIFTGGTASHAARLAGSMGSVATLTPDDLRRDEEYVYATSSREVAAARNIDPNRARVLPSGITAMRVIARHYDIERLMVTRHGLREGVILEGMSGSPP